MKQRNNKVSSFTVLDKYIQPLQPGINPVKVTNVISCMHDASPMLHIMIKLISYDNDSIALIHNFMEDELILMKSSLWEAQPLPKGAMIQLTPCRHGIRINIGQSQTLTA